MTHFQLITFFRSNFNGFELFLFFFAVYFYIRSPYESLATGYVPIEWNISKVTPIQKIKHTKKASEFRPINSMPTDEIIMEYVVEEQLTKYLAENNLLALHQSAFRHQHSCETTRNYFINV